MLNRRWSERTPLNEAAKVVYPPLGTLDAVVHDASLGGARVSIDNSLPENARVEIRLGDRIRIPAYVVRGTAPDLGMAFGNMDLDTFRALQTTLHGAAAA